MITVDAVFSHKCLMLSMEVVESVRVRKGRKAAEDDIFNPAKDVRVNYFSILSNDWTGMKNSTTLESFITLQTPEAIVFVLSFLLWDENSKLKFFANF